MDWIGESRCTITSSWPWTNSTRTLQPGGLLESWWKIFVFVWILQQRKKQLLWLPHQSLILERNILKRTAKICQDHQKSLTDIQDIPRLSKYPRYSNSKIIQGPSIACLIFFFFREFQNISEYFRIFQGYISDIFRIFQISFESGLDFRVVWPHADMWCSFRGFVGKSHSTRSDLWYPAVMHTLCVPRRLEPRSREVTAKGIADSCSRLCFGPQCVSFKFCAIWCWLGIMGIAGPTLVSTKSRFTTGSRGKPTTSFLQHVFLQNGHLPSPQTCFTTEPGFTTKWKQKPRKI